ncbi:MAG: serine/threonine protein kinase, partial [Proteobacteria bacterium]
MRSCPACLRSYPDDAGFCPADGGSLRPAAEVVAHDPNDARVGKWLARRYELRRIVADGGMGRVYEGIDHVANARIAVKILHKEVSTDEVALERFKREYDISRELRHPHVVAVHDFANEDGTWFLVMEYLDGEELRLILDRKE